MSISIVALCLLSLLQCTCADPRPEFALDATVPGTARVLDAVDAAHTAVAAITEAVLSYDINSELALLPQVAGIVTDIANQFQILGATIIDAIGTLASDASGNIESVFGAALDAVNEAVAFATDTLPHMNDLLVPLIGSALPDKFVDSLQHIDKALQALLSSLGELQEKAETAVAQAGSATVPSNIVNQNMRAAVVSKLTSALSLLRGTVPLLQYIIASTMENIALADEFMLALDDKVDMTMGESSALAMELDDIIDLLDTSFSTALDSIDVDLTGISSVMTTLTNLALAPSSAPLATILGDFRVNLDTVMQADPAVAAILANLKTSVTDAYSIADPLYYINESPLVDTLMTTLVANDKYSRYCFYKYKSFFFILLDSIATEASNCIAKETQRLEYIMGTIELLFEILFFDLMDIPDDLQICDGIADPTNLEECTAKFVNIYSALDGRFGDKLRFSHSMLQHEITASSNRLKICILLSQSELADTETPRLIQKINDCASDGPYAEDD